MASPISYLGEKPPPLPVPEFEVSSTVPLDNFHGGQLLLSLGKGSGVQKTEVTYLTFCLEVLSFHHSVLHLFICSRKKNKSWSAQICCLVKYLHCYGSSDSFILAGHISSAPGLEADDHICDLNVSLLLQVGQDSSSEENFTLTDAVQVWVQLQSFYLTWRGQRWLSDLLKLEMEKDETFCPRSDKLLTFKTDLLFLPWARRLAFRP